MYNKVKRGRRRLVGFRDRCQVMIEVLEGEVREEGQAGRCEKGKRDQMTGRSVKRRRDEANQ